MHFIRPVFEWHMLKVHYLLIWYKLKACYFLKETTVILCTPLGKSVSLYSPFAMLEWQCCSSPKGWSPPVQM